MKLRRGHFKKYLSLLMVLIMMAGNLSVFAEETVVPETLAQPQIQKLLDSPVETATTTPTMVVPLTLVDGSEPPTDPDEYAIWKENLINTQISAGPSLNESISPSQTALYSSAMAAGNQSNAYLEYALSYNGRFTIGTTGGNPDSTTDDNQKMLFGHPSPGTSYTTAFLDGTPIVLQATPSGSTTMLSANGVEITQELSLVKNNSTQREDVVQIKYTATNTDTTDHTLGLRIMMDTMLGDNDYAPFRIPGIGSVTTETELSGAEMPEYWQAFDSLLNPAVIAQGSLGTGTNRPDTVQFTNWGDVSSQPWGYQITPGQENGDSAVSMIWNPDTLEPGETRVYTTHYGLSDFNEDLRPPLALSVSSATELTVQDTEYSPNPFTVSAYILNNSGALAQNVTAQIILPEGLVLSEGSAIHQLGDIASTREKQLAWKVSALKTPVEKTLSYEVKIWADNAPEKSVSRSVRIPALAMGPTVYQITEEGKDYYLVGFDEDRPTQVDTSAIIRAAAMNDTEAAAIADGQMYLQEETSPVVSETPAPFALVTTSGGNSGKVYSYNEGVASPWQDTRTTLTIPMENGTSSARTFAAAAEVSSLYSFPSVYSIKKLNLESFRGQILVQVKAALENNGVLIPPAELTNIKAGIFHGVDRYGFGDLVIKSSALDLKANESSVYYLYARHMTGLALSSWMAGKYYNGTDNAYNQLKSVGFLSKCGYMTPEATLGLKNGREYTPDEFYTMGLIGQGLGMDYLGVKQLAMSLLKLQSDYTKLKKLSKNWVMKPQTAPIWYMVTVPQDPSKPHGKKWDLYTRVQDDYGNATAIRCEEGKTTGKQYLYSGGAWSDTGNYYAGAPTDGAVLTATAVLAPGVTAMEMTTRSEMSTSVIVIVINAALRANELKSEFKSRLDQFDPFGLMPLKERYITNGVSFSIDDNLFMGLCQRITKETAPRDEDPYAYYFWQARAMTDSAFYASFITASTGSAIKAWQAMTVSGTSALFLAASGGTSAVVTGPVAVEQAAEAVAFAGISYACAGMAGNSKENMERSEEKKADTEAVCLAEQNRLFYDELKNTDKFAQNALKHIFEGDPVNATGFHYKNVPGGKGKIIKETRSRNAFGVYEAEVSINGKVKDGVSTFFPDDWPPQRVVDSIRQAYGNAKPKGSGYFKGKCSAGFDIRFYFDGTRITTAYPLM